MALVWITSGTLEDVERFSQDGRIQSGILFDRYSEYSGAWKQLRSRLFAGVIKSTAVVWKDTSPLMGRESVDFTYWTDAELSADLGNDSFTRITPYIKLAPQTVIDGRRHLLSVRDVRMPRLQITASFPPKTTTSMSEAAIIAEPFVYLGDAVDWLVCGGNQISYDDYFDACPEKERALFDAIQLAVDTTGLKIRGVTADDATEETVVLPHNIWSGMNLTPGTLPTFLPLDTRAKSYSGGTVYCSAGKFERVKVPTSLVLALRPVSSDRPSISQIINTEAVSTHLAQAPFAPTRSGDDAKPRNPYELASDLLADYVARGERVTRDQFVGLCSKFASSTVAREIHSKGKPSHWTRGRQKNGQT